MWFDFLVLAILLYSTIRGAMKGIVWQLAAIGALILCFAFAESFSLGIRPYLPIDPPLNRWVAMLICYLVFSFASFAIARKVRDWIEKAKFVEYDRHVGAIFGLVKGVIFSLVLTFFVVTLSTSARATVLNTYSGHAAAIIMDRLHPVMPSELHEVLEPYLQHLDHPDLNSRNQYEDIAHEEEDGQSHQNGGGHGQPGSESDSGESLLQGLAEIFDAELRTMVVEALENTAPQDRPELREKLQSGIPGLMRMVAEEWQDGKPQAESASALESDRLIREISAVYSDAPHAQEAIQDEVVYHLSGVPDHVSVALLRDWHSDLLGLQPDPDPETGMTTTLDTRLLRQLSAARVPLTALSRALQQRLRDALPR